MSKRGSRRWRGKQRKSPEGSHLCLVAKIAGTLPKTGSISAITQSAETGMIIVRLPSTRAFMVGFGTTKLTRVWEPALLWNQLRKARSRPLLPTTR
jgi:hypothetical protein